MNNELLIPNKITYSKRKSLSLLIDMKGQFFVRAPIGYSIDKIASFIEKKSDWIIKKRVQATSMIKYPSLRFDGQDIMPLFDTACRVVVGEYKTVKRQEDALYVPNVGSKSKLVAYLKKSLRKYIQTRLQYISETIKIDYTSFSISSARTNWGSCSSRNKLHFTYKLAMCPYEVIDYIIIHELSHCVVKNHSTRFWRLVEQNCPNYKSIEKWLKTNKYIIDIV